MSEHDDQRERDTALDLVRRIGEGDRSAETEMVRRYSRGMHYVLRRRTNDEALAADLVQDAFCIAIERLRRQGIDQPERLAGFLYSTARNLLIAHQRKEWRRATVVNSDTVAAVPDETYSPFRDVSRAQNSRLVHQLLGELKVPRDRELLKRLYVQDQGKDEICLALGLDSLHFNRVLHRAKQRFRELLEHAEHRAQLRVVDGTAALRPDRTA